LAATTVAARLIMIAPIAVAIMMSIQDSASAATDGDDVVSFA
jgi:hypothetical protein